MGDTPKYDTPKYDTAHLRTLQQDLGRLNDAFLPRATRGRGVSPRAARLAPGAAAPAKVDEKTGAARRSAKSKTAATSAKSGAKPKAGSKSSVRAKAGKAGTLSSTKAGRSTAKAGKAAGAKALRAAAARDTQARSAVAPRDKSRAGARRLLVMLRRIDGDDSPPVPGTDFTEAGVVRLLGHLRRRKSQGFRFLRHLYRLLTRPVALGMRTSAGIGVERLQLVGRQLEEIEIHGWDHFHSRRVARRGRQGLPFAPAASSPDAPVPESS